MIALDYAAFEYWGYDILSSTRRLDGVFFNSWPDRSGIWLAGKRFRSSTYHIFSNKQIFLPEQHRGGLLSFTVTLPWICGDLLRVLDMLMVLIILFFCSRNGFLSSGFNVFYCLFGDFFSGI